MAALPEVFTPADIPEDDRSFEPLPAGNYRVQVVDSKIEDTKSGTGQMLVLTLEVIEGPYQNRKLWDRLNIRNQNPDAQRIAQISLAELCKSIGVTTLKDSEELHFKPMTVRVRIENDKTGQYGPQNRVRYGGGKQGQPPVGKPSAGGSKSTGKPAQAAGAKPWNQPKQAAPQNDDMADEVPF